MAHLSDFVGWSLVVSFCFVGRSGVMRIFLDL